MIVLILSTLLLLFISILLLNGKAAMLIAGYNTLSKEDRAKINERKLCRDMGILILGVVTTFIFYFIGILREQEIYFIIGTVLMFLWIIARIIYMYSGNRYEKTTEE